MSANARPSVPDRNLSMAQVARLSTTASVPPTTVHAPASAPVVGEPFATLELGDDDIIGIAVAPISMGAVAASRARTSSLPPRTGSIPAPPDSGIVARSRPTAGLVCPPTPDPTDLLFDGMYGLAFTRSKAEAAELCAELLGRALGARAVVVHTHDLVSGELRAIGAHGDGDFDIIGSAEPSDDDLVASAVMCNRKPVMMCFDGELSRIAPKRLHAVGAPRTLVAAPAMAWGRCLAIIEVIDADERYVPARVADAATYVGSHFARFLSSRAA